MPDPARQRLNDGARLLRTIVAERRPLTYDLLTNIALVLSAPIVYQAAVPTRCVRADCDEPLPPYRGRGPHRKHCEKHRPPRVGQYRANTEPAERIDA